MDANVQLALAIVQLAAQAAPIVFSALNDIKAQEGKTADEIFAETGVLIDANEARALALLAGLLPTKAPEAPPAPEPPPPAPEPPAEA